MPKKLTHKEFIKRCKKLYGDTYDYTDTKYITTNFFKMGQI